MRPASIINGVFYGVSDWAITYPLLLFGTDWEDIARARVKRGARAANLSFEDEKRRKEIPPLFCTGPSNFCGRP
jgi:hypothetical protein